MVRNVKLFTLFLSFYTDTIEGKEVVGHKKVDLQELVSHILSFKRDIRH